MGREIKRVALDFNWPMDKPWKGFINPWYEFNHNCQNCNYDWASYEYDLITPACGGMNYEGAKEYTAIQRFVKSERWSRVFTKEIVEAIYLDRHSRHRIINDPFYSRIPFTPFKEMYKNQYETELPDRVYKYEDMSDLTEEDHCIISFIFEMLINGKMPGQVTDDTMYKLDISYPVLCAKSKLSGQDHRCPECNGYGNIWDPPEAEQKAEDWEKIEPPAGEGWQMWETVSEGSPVTPVFATADELVDHLVDVGDAPHSKWNTKYSREAAEKFVKGSGWVPSGVIHDGKMYNSVEVALVMESDKTDG